MNKSSTNIDENIELHREWSSIEETYAIGSGFINDSFHDANDLAGLFSHISNSSEIETMLDNINGFFSIITKTDSGLLISGDHIASFPLFYMQKNNKFYVSDDPSWLHEKSDIQTYDKIAELEYLLSGYVTGRDTLSPNILQLLAGECILFPTNGGNKIDRKRWYRFPQTNVDSIKGKKNILQKIDRVMSKVYQRLIAYADGRPIVVSLSSGYDSRLNLIMLSKLEYDNIIALTHQDRSGESTLCKDLVEDLGIPWVYISRNHEDWYRWYNSQEYNQYQSQCRHLDRIPTLEGVLSVKVATEQSLVPTDSVFVTGDGVMSTGEHIQHKYTNNQSTTPNELIDTIVNSHYKYGEWDRKTHKILRKRVSKGLKHPEVSTSTDAVQLMEQWDWQERQAKFIPRKHIYEYWDYEWWMPLWDREFVGFWNRLPIEFKFNKQIFRDYVEESYAQVADVDKKQVERTIWNGENLGQILKHKLRSTRFDPVGTNYEKLARKTYYNLVNPVKYEDDPMFGIMKKEQFEELRTGVSPIIHRFQALEVLDRISFDSTITHNNTSGNTISIEDL